MRTSEACWPSAAFSKPATGTSAGSAGSESASAGKRSCSAFRYSTSSRRRRGVGPTGGACVLVDGSMGRAGSPSSQPPSTTARAPRTKTAASAEREMPTHYTLHHAMLLGSASRIPRADRKGGRAEGFWAFRAATGTLRWPEGAASPPAKRGETSSDLGDFRLFSLSPSTQWRPYCATQLATMAAHTRLAMTTDPIALGCT